MTKYAGVLLVVVALVLAGCSKAEKQKSGDMDSGSMAQHKTMEGGSHETMGGTHETMGGTGSMGAMKKTAEKVMLPAGANKVCPVSGDPVDPTIFVTYKGKKVYFCCDKCPKQFNADPAKYFAKAYPDAAGK